LGEKKWLKINSPTLNFYFGEKQRLKNNSTKKKRLFSDEGEEGQID